MVLVCWLQDYITKADPSESELCEGLAKCGGTNLSLPRVGIARPESLPELSRRHFNEQCSQKTSEMRYDLGHKMLFARAFWPKGVNSVPEFRAAELQQNPGASESPPCEAPGTGGEESVGTTLSSLGFPQFIPCQIVAGYKCKGTFHPLTFILGPDNPGIFCGTQFTFEFYDADSLMRSEGHEFHFPNFET